MTWKPEIEELKRREALAHQMGGKDKVARQHDFGKLTIRERIDAIIDPESLHEIGALAGVGEYDEEGRLKGFTPANFVFGTAEIDGRPVVVSGDDFTVRGGSADASIPGKRALAEGLAKELRLPHIRLVDGMGGGGSVKTIERAGRTYIPQLRGWDTVVEHLAVAPSVSLALGSVAGIGAARVATSHYSVIVRDTAQMMIAGPALVDWASLGEVSKEELGHARIHTRNGSIDDEVSSEAEAFASAKRFISYLPTNVDELPPLTESNDDPQRREQSLLDIVPRNPRRVYRMRSLMTMAHNVLVFVTPRSSGIESISDLAGKRVVVGVAGAGWEFFIRPILEAHGLSYDDFTPLHNTQAGSVDMLADGSAAAAFLGGAVPTASIVQATTSSDVLLVPFDEDRRAALVEQYPFYFDVPIPAGTYRGQDEEFAGLNCGSMHLIVHEDMDDELAYEITRTIYENGDRIAEKHPAGLFIRADNVTRDNGTPFHPGAIQYYREIGIWPDGPDGDDAR